MQPWMRRAGVGVGSVVAGSALWLIWLRQINWSTPFASGLLGAVLGALAGAVGAGVVTLRLAQRTERQSRIANRSERALDEIAGSLETIHWPLANRYVEPGMRVLTTGSDGNIVDRYFDDAEQEKDRQELLSALVDEAIQLRTLFNRVSDDVVREAFVAYITTILKVKTQRAVPKDKLLADLLELMALTNEALGHRRFELPGEAAWLKR